MSFMDKLLSSMRLNDDDEDYYDDDYDYEDDEDIQPAPKKFASKIRGKQAELDDDYEDKPSKKNILAANKVTPIRQPVTRRVPAGGNGMNVCVIKPTSIEDAKEITETLLENRTVVLNLEGLDVDIAQRIIDITYGSCYAISGNLQKISQYIFLITPASVDISGDFQDIINGTFEVPMNSGL